VDKNGRPEIVDLYVKKMGAVDRFDQNLREYAYLGTSVRWTMPAILFLVNAAAYNSYRVVQKFILKIQNQNFEFLDVIFLYFVFTKLTFCTTLYILWKKALTPPFDEEAKRYEFLEELSDSLMMPKKTERANSNDANNYMFQELRRNDNMLKMLREKSTGKYPGKPTRPKCQMCGGKTVYLPAGAGLHECFFCHKEGCRIHFQELESCLRCFDVERMRIEQQQNEEQDQAMEVTPTSSSRTTRSMSKEQNTGHCNVLVRGKNCYISTREKCLHCGHPFCVAHRSDFENGYCSECKGSKFLRPTRK